MEAIRQEIFCNNMALKIKIHTTWELDVFF